MWYEIVRELIRKVIHDKILLALVVFGVVAFFMNGMTSGNEPDSPHGQIREVSAQKPVLEPNLASDFVKWWLTSAMDYSPRTSRQSHTNALAWMTPEAKLAFQQSFWPQALADSISSGKITCAFQMQAVEPLALNPDGSVVVGLNGTLVYQAGGQPISSPIMTEFLVCKERAGLRVCGLYNRAQPIPSASVY